MSNSSVRPARAGAEPRLDQIRAAQRLRVHCPARGVILVEQLRLALGPFSRLRGLLARPPLQPGQGLLLRPCRQVHTCFMRYPIDVVLLDAAGVVLALETLPPFRLGTHEPRARAVLELPAGHARRCGLQTGERLAFRETDPVD